MASALPTSAHEASAHGTPRAPEAPRASPVLGAARALAGLLSVALLAVLLLPVGLLAALWLLAGNVFVRRARTGGPAPAPLPVRDTSAASILVLNWNGRAFLERLMPSLQAAVEAHGGAHQVIVIDNGSTDASVAWLRAHWPHVEVVRHERNEKFVRGYNKALGAATRDVLVLLNNDMVVDRGFLGPLLDALARHPRAFAAAARIEMADPARRGIETGRTAGRWSGGMFKLAHLPVAADGDAPWPCLWPGGGACAVDRRAFVARGGFEALFDPYYFEDTSLGYQAWRRGEFVLLVPEAVVEHVHRGSSSRVRPFALERVLRRNAHLFAWRSFDDWRMTLAATLLLPLTGARVALRGGFARAARAAAVEAAAVASALARLPAAAAARARTRRHAVRSDREALALAHSRHRTTRALGVRPAADRPLRLLMLLARVPRRDADGSFVQFDLLRRLGERHHVTVCALAEDAAMARRADDLAPHVARIETLLLTREPARCDLLRRDPAGFRRDYSDARIRARLAELLASEAFDVVQVDYIEMAYALEGLLDGLASVHVVHEPLGSAAWPGAGSRLRALHERARALLMERRLLRPFARIVCMTTADAAMLRACHPELRPVVITNGIDVGRHAPCPPSAAPTLLFVGSYAHPPNADAAEFAAREVLPRVRARVPQARLLLAGADPHGRLAALHACPGVEQLGFVADLAAVARDAGAVLAPLRAGGGMRSKVLEALAWAKPVVGTPLAFTGVAGRSGEHYLAADGAEALAEACVRVLCDAELRARLGRAGRALVEAEHDARAMAAAYEAVYRDLVAEVPR
ncbi:MAG TPA: glycosyltransferase [Planctomycetota bacterium]|nr:glycosyltransferase [Planctomycetota bacterium]